MDKVREFYRRALECKQLAQEATTQDIKGRYEDLACTWEKLAEEQKIFFIERFEMDGAGLSIPGALK